MIKILHIQKHLPSSGNAAFRLHEAMLRNGLSSTMLSLTSEISEDNFIKHLSKKAYLISFFNDKSEGVLTKGSVKKYGLFSYPLYGSDISNLNQVKNADIIYLHWVIGGFLNLNGMKKISKLGKPIIVFMHDMWPITGGCHYSFECEKFKIMCESCQNFSSKKLIDLAKIEFKKKLKFYEKYDNLYFVSPSKWLYREAKQSYLTTNKPIFHIPNVINRKIYRPHHKSEARNILDLDISSTIITFGAVSVESPYKGWNYLQKAISILKENPTNENILIVIFGSAYNEQMASNIPFPTKFFGRLRDDYSTAAIYNASDVFIAPSLADNLPTTIMESLSCGTPVVGFDVGGIPDMIIHKKNGYLAKYKDSNDLALGIEYCLKQNIRGYLAQDFEENEIIAKHLNLHSSIRVV